MNTRTLIRAGLMMVLGACGSALAQEQPAEGGFLSELYTSTTGFAVPDRQKIVPVRILREFELGTALERFAASNNRLLERREKELPEAAWKIDSTTAMSPTAIIIKDVVRVNDRRLGGRIEYLAQPAGRGEQRASHLLDVDELKDVESALSTMNRAMRQTDPAKDESIAMQYRSRSGFVVSLNMNSKQVNARFGNASADSKEKIGELFEGAEAMVHKLVQYLATL